MPTTQAAYLLALVCSSGDVFASGLSTSAPICYRAEPEASYSLTYTSLAVAANSQNLGLAATPTRANETTRLTAFTRSSNAWVAKRPASDTQRTAAKVWVARAIPPTIQNPSFSCPAASAGLETAANNTLTVSASISLRGAITAATNGNANVGNVTNSAGNWSTFQHSSHHPGTRDCVRAAGRPSVSRVNQPDRDADIGLNSLRGVLLIHGHLPGSSACARQWRQLCVG